MILNYRKNAISRAEEVSQKKLPIDEVLASIAKAFADTDTDDSGGLDRDEISRALQAAASKINGEPVTKPCSHLADQALEKFSGNSFTLSLAEFTQCVGVKPFSELFNINRSIQDELKLKSAQLAVEAPVRAVSSQKEVNLCLCVMIASSPFTCLV